MGKAIVAFVLDDSVTIAWFIPAQANDYTRRVGRRAEREQPVVPALWEVEFANVMLVLVRRRTLARHQGAAILGRIVQLRLAVDRAEVSPRAFCELGERHGISAYDAAYLELAARRGLPLATRDVKLRNAARTAGIAIA